MVVEHSDILVSVILKTLLIAADALVFWIIIGLFFFVALNKD